MKKMKKDMLNAVPESNDDYKVDDAMHTLMRAEEHKQDTELMKKVHHKLGKKKKAITSLQQLREVAKEKLEEEA